MSLELKIIATVFFGIYLIYFLLSKNYIKTYIPFMGLGYVLGPYGWDLFRFSIREPILFFLVPAVFIMGLQMGRGFGRTFWRKFPVYTFFYSLIEKIILMAGFLAIFFLVIPSFVFMPISFPFYLSIIAFSSSFFFFHFISSKIRPAVSFYYEMNHLIIMIFLTMFYFIFPIPSAVITEYGILKKWIVIFLFSFLVFLVIRLKILNAKVLIALWTGLILMGAGISRIIGFSPIIIGFLTGLSSNFMSARKQVIIKKFFFLFNEYMIVLFLFTGGYLMDISPTVLLIGVAYLALRIFSRIFIRYFSLKNFSLTNFFHKDILSLFQGEYFLAFLIIYAVEYEFPKALSVALISLLFSEILINYYYYRYVNQKSGGTHV